MRQAKKRPKKPQPETEAERLKRERGALRKLRGPQTGLGTRKHRETRKDPKEMRRKWKSRRYKGDMENI